MTEQSALSNFKTARDSNSAHKIGTVWLLPYLITKYNRAAFAYRLTGGNVKNRQQEGEFTTYCHRASYSRETYATENVIAEAGAKFHNLLQTAGMPTDRYRKVLWEKTIWRGSV